MQSGDASIVYEKPQAYRGALLCFHGMTGQPLEMERLVKVGRMAGFHASSPTLRGHQGGSIDMLRKTALRQWLTQAEQELEQIKQESGDVPIIVAGLSFGALLAIYLASRYPEQIKGVFACSTPFLLHSPWGGLVSHWGSLLPDVVLNYLGTVKKSSRRRDCWAMPRNSMDRHSLGAVMRMHKLLKMLTPQLGKIRANVILLQDPHDHHLSPSSAPALAAMIPSGLSEVVYLPRGEHELTVGWGYSFVEECLAKFLASFSKR